MPASASAGQEPNAARVVSGVMGAMCSAAMEATVVATLVSILGGIRISGS